MGVTEAFVKSLPKVELHAHLSGSISKECLHEIWQERRSQDPDFELEDPLTALSFKDGKVLNIDTFFPLFTTYIYTLRSTLPLVRRTTFSVLQSFANDGVVYLELRTTPQSLPACPPSSALPPSKEEYIATILSGIKGFGREKMDTYLILSIDRKNTPAEAMEVVELAAQFKPHGVVGVDLCGDPRVPLNIDAVGPAFTRAKELGLGRTAHFAEVEDSASEWELRALLDLKPERLGHVVHVSDAMQREIADKGIALELCPTGNVVAGLTQGGFENHHASEWIQRDGACGPIVLCTDDVGIFGNQLSGEFLKAGEQWGLSREECLWLCDCGVDAMFGPNQARGRLVQRIEKCRGEITGYNMDRALGVAEDQ